MSKKWSLNKTDIERVGRNALIFLLPVAITELTLLVKGVTDSRMYLAAFEVWALGVLTDLARKLQAGK